MNPSMQTVSVALGDRSYPIHIGENLLTDTDGLRQLLAPHLRSSQVAVVSNATVAALYAAQVEAALPAQRMDLFTMQDGEQYKNLQTYGALLDFLMAHRHNRTTCLIALGGGVVGDLCGFAAATFQRGVDFIQIPTTLLAQVDSSVGGKTAVNHPSGKNMIGAFYQPRAVLIDTTVLRTLPLREYAAGLAEVVKYGVIADAEFFDWLEAHVDALNAREENALNHVIRRSCEIKAAVVAQDERESGMRAILNFGHTFGHAIENLSGYGAWLHGEAVALGMVMAARFSEQLGCLQPGHALRLRQLLSALQLPVKLRGAVESEALVEAMGMDKKAADGRLRFIITKSFGSAELTDLEDEGVLRGVLEEFCAASETNLM